MSTATELKFLGQVATEQLIANVKNALDDKQSKSDTENIVTATLSQAKESGEFDGSRGTGILRVTTSTTSASGTGSTGIAIKYKIALSTVLNESGAAEVLVGDTVARSYYQYPVAMVDSNYVYLGAYTSIRGATGTKGDDGVGIVDITIAEV